ncbi:MAG TPA: hypothetical protein V6C88_06150, partial [Chroococcidiopsis sp.]
VSHTQEHRDRRQDAYTTSFTLLPFTLFYSFPKSIAIADQMPAPSFTLPPVGEPAEPPPPCRLVSAAEPPPLLPTDTI